jgi:hypothetical protein
MRYKKIQSVLERIRKLIFIRPSSLADAEQEYNKIIFSLADLIEEEGEKLIGKNKTEHGDFCFPDENEMCVCGIDPENELREEQRVYLKELVKKIRSNIKI